MRHDVRMIIRGSPLQANAGEVEESGGGRVARLVTEGGGPVTIAGLGGGGGVVTEGWGLGAWHGSSGWGTLQ